MATTNIYIAPEDGWVNAQVEDAAFVKIMAFPSRTFYVWTGSDPADTDIGMRIDPNKGFCVNQYVAGPVYVRVLDNAQPQPGQDVRIDIEQEFGTASPPAPPALGPQTPANSLSVTPAGLEYETVAAGQTAQVLGSTGAAGDYLSHVILQPTTTAAGTMTILDNATVIFTFTTGTLSNLAPITIPIGAFSVSGAWKITTGANETATAFGNFT